MPGFSGRLTLANKFGSACGLALSFMLAQGPLPARAADSDGARGSPATELGGPVLPVGAMLLKRAGPVGNSDVLRVGVADSGYPPLEIITTGGQVAGITADYAALVGRHLKKRVEVVNANNFSDVLKLLKTGEIDMVGSVSRTPEREAYALFSTPFLVSTPVVVQRREMEKRDDAKLGTVIAVDKASAVIEFIKRDVPTAKLVELASPLAALQFVARGQADSYVGELITAAYLIETRYLSSLRITSAAGFPTGDLRFAVSTAQPALARGIDAALAGISDAEHENIRRRWLPFATLATAQSTRIDLSAQEQAWLRAHPEIRLGAEPSYVPFSMVGDDGRFEGLAADYLKLVAERTGLNVRLLPGLNWTAILDGIKGRTVDITPAVVETPERRAFMRFAGPIVALPTVFVTPVASKRYVDGFGSMSGQRMALIKSGPVTSRVEREFPGIIPVYVDNTAEALEKVASGDADFAVSNINFITREIESRYLGTLKIAGTLADSPTELNIGVRSDWPELQSIIRKGINTISRTEHEAIRQKWLSVKINQGYAWSEVLKVGIPLLLGLLAIIAVTLLANRRLHRQFLKTKAAENRVAYQLALQSSLLDAVPTPVFVVDPQARYTDCNRAYETIFAVQRDAIRGKTLLEWSDPSKPEIQQLHADMLSVLGSRETRISDYQVSMPDGHDIHFSGAARVFALPDGTAGGLVGTVVDVSQEHARQRELAEARDRAESATKAKSAFLATMSHEIRTPMNGVLGMLELLAHTPLNPDQRHSIAIAQESGRALLTLLSDVLDLSKIEANKLTIESAPTDLRSLSESVIQTLAGDARTKGLKLHLFVAPDVASAHVCDALRLRQILFNLLGNAIKFTLQGHVSLRITSMDAAMPDAPQQQRIAFAVVDTGIGIAEQAQAHLFAPFEQAEPSTSRQFGGTGLGLAICRRLAELMGASLTLQSTLGTGTTMRLEADFPVRDQAQAPRRSQVQKIQHGLTKVMLLADDKTDEETLAVYLGARHFEALVPSLALVGEAWLRQFLQVQRPHAVIVSPAVLTRLSLSSGELITLMQQAGSHLLSPALVWLTDQPQSGRQLANQPLLPSAVAALLADWHSRASGTPNAVANALRAAAIQEGYGAVTTADAPRILVAEDHPTNQAIVCKQLEMIGCTVTLCADGAIALATWIDARVDPARRFGALMIDCHMPLMDGYELARRVRACEAGAAREQAGGYSQPRVPMIALTADAGSEVRLLSMAAGMDDLLVKPVDIPTLRTTLARWLPAIAMNAAGPGTVLHPPECHPFDMPEKAFHLDRLVSEMGGHAAAAGLMADYLQATQQDISNLQGAADDPVLARRIAHRMKGAARIVGAQRIERIATRLEAQTDAIGLLPESVAAAAAELLQALADVTAEVQKMAELA